MIKEFDKVTILTILLFGLLVLLYALKLRLFNKFNFDTLTKAFNKIITIQVVVVVVVAIVLNRNTIDKVVYSIGQGNMLTSIIVSTAMTYIIIAGFSIFQKESSLNLINLIFTKKQCILPPLSAK
jgi:hypothetical protein